MDIKSKNIYMDCKYKDIEGRIYRLMNVLRSCCSDEKLTMKSTFDSLNESIHLHISTKSTLIIGLIEFKNNTLAVSYMEDHSRASMIFLNEVEEIETQYGKDQEKQK